MNRTIVVVLAAFAVLVFVLAAGLRRDAFFVGDQGVKLIAARNALRFPAHPLQIPLPQIAGESTPHVESFFVVHGDHAHAITSELFPVLSAPLLAAFGMRGLYVLPAMGFIATLAAVGWLAVVLDARRSGAIVIAAAALGTPFLFYGLEFWEHTVALALGVSGIAWLLDLARRPRTGRWQPLAAGVLCGAAIVLRPESAWFVVAAVLASRTLASRLTWSSLALTALGVVIAMLPFEIYAIQHFGSFVPGHVGTNAAVVDMSWLAVRRHLLADWLLPSWWTSAGPVRPASLWSVAPAAAVGMLALATRPGRDGRAFLWILLGVTVVAIVLSAPNDGGGQWGPRYLLFAYVPLAILAADVFEQIPRGVLRTLAAIVLIVACVWVERTAYRQLRGTKSTYGRIVDFVSATTQDDGYVVTDVWWLDQLAASALDRRTVLFAGEPETGRGIVRRLSDASVPRITVVRSRELSPDVESWSMGTCYREESRESVSVRQIVAIRLRRDCQPAR